MLNYSVYSTHNCNWFQVAGGELKFWERISLLIKEEQNLTYNPYQLATRYYK